AEQQRVGPIEQASRRPVRRPRAARRRPDAEEELLAHAEIPLAARAGLPGVAHLWREHVAVAGIVGAERQGLRVDAVVDLGAEAERVLDLAAEAGHEDGALPGPQQKAEAGDGERILRVGGARQDI